MKIRCDGHVCNRSGHIALEDDMEGVQQVLEIRVQNDEGSSCLAYMCAQLTNDRIRDVLFVCYDGLIGLSEAVEAPRPDSMIQTCVVHLIRSSMRFLVY